MRVCTIYKCTKAGDRRCCVDCDKISCPNRCQNHPDRCKCWSDEEPLKQGQKRGSVKSEDVVALAEQGLSDKEIGAALHLKPAGIHYHLSKLGYRRRPQPATAEQCEQILALEIEGKPYKEIADAVGLGVDAVYYQLKKAGVYRRNRGGGDGG